MVIILYFRGALMQRRTLLAAIPSALISACAPSVGRNSTSSLVSLGIEPCSPPIINAPRVLRRPPNMPFYAPSPPEYPYPATVTERSDLERYITCLSSDLKNYIRAWSAGNADARIPDALIPWGTNRSDFRSFTLQDPRSMDPKDQWVVRPAHKIDPSRLYGSFPDPNCTYLVAPALLAPFDSTLIVDGQFPRARYFSAQATVPFSLDVYRYDLGIGAGEVPIVDVDIEPNAGNVNPFRVGANRNASNRDYRLRFDLTQGDAASLNRAFQPPNFRQRGNTRKASMLVYEGPWGHPGSDGHKRGLFAPGQLWLRYYAPDKGTEPLAGVPLPRMSFQLPTGELFFIKADLNGIKRRSERRRGIGRDDAAAPEAFKFQTEEYGWIKQAGIFESIVGGIVIGTQSGNKSYVNQMVRGVAGRGDTIPAPGNYDQSATSATHIDYLVRGMNLERNHVVIMTGKLPTFPQTRDGQARMEAAQARYWSITGYHVPRGFDFVPAALGLTTSGLASQSIMDDEVIIDEQRNYVIVFSRDNERPSNATAVNRVNWVDWGASAEISWTFRWMSIAPEWRAPFAPTPQNLGSRSDYWSSRFNPSATFRNTHSGEMGAYLPKISYVPRSEFEMLGSNVGQTLRKGIP